MYIDILDVGHGNCAVLRGQSDTVVIDAGLGSTALLEYFDTIGVAAVSTVLLSHADNDHLRGLIGLLASRLINVGSVRVNSDALKATRRWTALVYELDDLNRSGSVAFKVGLQEGDDIPFDDDAVAVAVLAPRPRLAAIGPGGKDREGRAIETNTVSAVIKISVAGAPAVLLPGDLDKVGLAHLLDAGVDIRCPTLVFPHHGGNCSKAATPDENAEFAHALCAAVQPDVVLFSIGRIHDTPRPEIVAAVRAANASVRVACTQLSTHCGGVPQSEGRHLLPTYAAGRDAGACCGGSFTIDLQRRVVLPEAQPHGEFIDIAAPRTALCR